MNTSLNKCCEDSYDDDVILPIMNTEISSITTYKHTIDSLTNHIQSETLTKLSDYEMVDILTLLINYKNTSNEYMKLYNDMICSFEKYDLMYTTKFNDLNVLILENMTQIEKNKLMMDSDGNYMVIVKPILKRSYRYHLYMYIENEDLYKLISSIKNTMIKIHQYENVFLNTSNNVTSVTK